jgi:hypothetical protein
MSDEHKYTYKIFNYIMREDKHKCVTTLNVTYY